MSIAFIATRGHVSSSSSRQTNAAECKYVNKNYESKTTHTQEEVHAYMKCNPGAGFSWEIFAVLGGILVVYLVVAFIMGCKEVENESTTER